MVSSLTLPPRPNGGSVPIYTLDTINFADCSPTNRCKDWKSCAHCSKSRRNRIGYALDNRTRDDASYYSITLTTLPSDDGRRQQITDLIKTFAAFRRRAACRPVIGGARWIEEGAQGNIHLHAFVRTDGAELNAKAIADAWFHMTGASEVYIKAIDSTEYHRNVCYYVDPTAELRDDSVRAKAFMRQTRGLRLVSTFGDFRGQPLLPRRSTAPAISFSSAVHSVPEITAQQIDPIGNTAKRLPRLLLEYIGAQSYMPEATATAPSAYVFRFDSEGIDNEYAKRTLYAYDAQRVPSLPYPIEYAQQTRTKRSEYPHDPPVPQPCDTTLGTTARRRVSDTPIPP